MLEKLEYWVVDTEFHSPDGGPIRVHCLCALNLRTGEERRIWTGGGTAAPWRWQPDDVLVAHYAMAELVSFLALGWQLPPEVIDTLPEWRSATGQKLERYRLIDVAAASGETSMSAEHKEAMRTVAMQPVVPTEQRAALVEYCMDDVRATVVAFRHLLQHHQLHLPALLRGRYLIHLARVEWRGLPVDKGLCATLTERWCEIRAAMAAEAAERYPGSFVGRRFSLAGWHNWCQARGISWPVTPTGRSRKDEDTMKLMAERHPEVAFMRDTLRLLGTARAVNLAPWADGRIRTMLSPFASATGRNQPSNSRYPFGMAAWLRAVIQAPTGRWLAYLDYSSQEFAAAAALSGDEAMITDYLTGDPYVGFGKRAGLIPPDGTKVTHQAERKICKTVVLGLQYGMGAQTLAGRLGVSEAVARDLVTRHRKSYRKYRAWNEANIEEITYGRALTTRFGWRREWKGSRDSANSAGNFLMQAAGGEILRIAVIALGEAGIPVVAPVHDALLIEVEHPDEIARARRIMERAAEAVLGIVVRTDEDVLQPGQHYVDDRGAAVWDFLREKLGIHYGR